MSARLEVADIMRRHGEAYRQAHEGHLGRVERPQDIRADEIGVAPAPAHGSISISSKIRRRWRSAYEVRLFTVPSGTPVRSAISRMVRPP